MFNQLAGQASNSAEPPVPQLGPPPGSECAQQSAVAWTEYMPYVEKPASEPAHKPYAERPAPDEQPYEPYKDI